MKSPRPSLTPSERFEAEAVSDSVRERRTLTLVIVVVRNGGIRWLDYVPSRLASGFSLRYIRTRNELSSRVVVPRCRTFISLLFCERCIDVHWNKSTTVQSPLVHRSSNSPVFVGGALIGVNAVSLGGSIAVTMYTTVAAIEKQCRIRRDWRATHMNRSRLERSVHRVLGPFQPECAVGLWGTARQSDLKSGKKKERESLVAFVHTPDGDHAENEPTGPVG